MTKITVGRGSCGIAAGADRIYDVFKTCSEAVLTSTGCIGTCFLEPIVDVIDSKGLNSKKTYVRVDETAAQEIIKHIQGQANEADKYLITTEDAKIINDQHRISMRQCGLIDPENIEEYGPYAAFKKAASLTPEAIIEIIKASELAGRGGAGFPTWFKWDACRKSPGDKKYMICNADEGDPGAFMDRAVIEGDPHALIEGMLIAAYAVGGRETTVEGVVYVRAEYPLAIKRLQTAIEQAESKGYLGENIMGTGVNFSLRIKEGAGAFVCGEETALIASLEGERGMPRLKPPFPAQKGYWQLPSNINNVETFANVPYIITNGAEAFSSIGTENSKGTKIFALTGNVKNGGLVEVPMGRTVREVVYGAGGGIKHDKPFKAVQMGGPSGGCIPAELLDTRIDYKELAATGAIMGSGGMVVMDEDTCMVDMARFFLDFTCKESCGKCVHCRVGTKRMLEMLERITEGKGEEGDIERLLALGEQIKEGSLCGLGQTAPNPVLTTIKYFRNEYEDHIMRQKCTACSCMALIRFDITDDCIGCTLCRKACGVQAIEGNVKEVHKIIQDKCVKCGKCEAVCKFNAIIKS